MSRQVYLLGWGLALVAGALAFTDWALSLRPGVTEANVRRIREGMTAEEVHALLGKPDLQQPADDEDSDVWFITDGYACVIYSGEFRRVDHAWLSWHHDRPDPSTRFRRWLGW